MKKYILPLILLSLISVNYAYAQTKVSYYEEVKALGIIAGQGMACNASKYDTYEMLARAILITKASSDSMQAKGMEIYNEEKANTFISKQFDGFYDCAVIANRFNNQDIFNMTLYADGTIRMPDGQIFTPRNPYDVTLVYKKDNAKAKAQTIYDKGSNIKAKNIAIEVEGIDTERTTIQQPVYDANSIGRSAVSSSSQAKVAAPSSVGRISRKKR